MTMKQARIINNVAVDVLPAELVPAAWAADFDEVPDDVAPQWVRLPVIVDDEPTQDLQWYPPASFVEEFEEGSFRIATLAVPPAPVTGARRITKLAFRNRFTLPEKVGLELAALDNPEAQMALRQAAAALRATLADQRDATFIDLDRADTRTGVQALESSGLLAAGRALQILDAPVQAHERLEG
jgi:hypothetical protein